MSNLVNEILEYSTAKTECIKAVEEVELFLRAVEIDDTKIAGTMIGNESLIENVKTSIANFLNGILKTIRWVFNKIFELIRKFINLIRNLGKKDYDLLTSLNKIKEGTIDYSVSDLEKMSSVHAFSSKILNRRIDNKTLRLLTSVYKDFIFKDGVLELSKIIKEAMRKDIEQMRKGNLFYEISDTEIGKSVFKLYYLLPTINVDNEDVLLLGLYNKRVHYAYIIKLGLPRGIYVSSTISSKKIYEDIEPITENDLNTYIEMLSNVSVKNIEEKIEKLKVEIERILDEIERVLPEIKEIVENGKDIRLHARYVTNVLLVFYLDIIKGYIATLETYIFGKAAPYYYHAYMKGKEV